MENNQDENLNENLNENAEANANANANAPQAPKKKALFIIIPIVIVILIMCLCGRKFFNISDDKGDTLAKFNNAYTAGIEVPENATDLRFKSNTLWWSGVCEVAFTLEEDEFEDYLNEINENYTLGQYYFDYGVAGLKVSDARINQKTNESYHRGFDFNSKNLEYLMMEDVEDYEVIYYENETESHKTILASREKHRIYFNIFAGG